MPRYVFLTILIFKGKRKKCELHFLSYIEPVMLSPTHIAILFMNNRLIRFAKMNFILKYMCLDGKNCFGNYFR